MRKSRLSQTKQQRLIELFISKASVREAADQAGVNRNTAAYYFHRLRQLIFHAIEENTCDFDENETDEAESDVRCELNRDRVAAGKILVFGILKGSKKVYTRVIPETRFPALVQIMKQRAIPGSFVYIGSLHDYKVLEVNDLHRVRVNSSEPLAAEADYHITNIEIFWSKAKHQLSRFNGIPREHFGLFLKECEWRFNNPNSIDQLALLEQLVNDQLGLVSKDSFENKMSPRCTGLWDSYLSMLLKGR